MVGPAIIVVTYNRPHSLMRLLNSIENAVYKNGGITLLISIDKTESSQTYEIAENFIWKNGNKLIIKHQEQLGLKEHILKCGDLTELHESVIILEDDLSVSPFFYEYAINAMNFYGDSNEIAGISLYNYQVAESCFYPFKAIDDNSDVYFMQVASSWGQLFTKRQWFEFRKWFALNPDLIGEEIPNYISLWGRNSWKKHIIHYLISSHKFFVFPRLSLSTNHEEKGVNSSTKHVFNVPLQLSEKQYSFVEWSDSKSKYDAWFELMPEVINKLNPELEKYDYLVDLYGIKELRSKPTFILTTRKGSQPILSYSVDLFPLDTNVVLNVKGQGIGLYNCNSVVQHKEKLALHNYLDYSLSNSRITISIIIPILFLEENSLIKTLNSLQQQNYTNKTVIIVTSKDSQSEINNIISGYGFDYRIVICEEKKIDGLVLQGFKNCFSTVATWIFSGVVLKSETLFQIESIFTDNKSINWIKGINGVHDEIYAYERLNVLRHRTTAAETYSDLYRNKIDSTIEGNFVRTHCFGDLLDKAESLCQLYILLIDQYQKRIAVYSFFNAPYNKAIEEQLLEKDKVFGKNILAKHANKKNFLKKFVMFIVYWFFYGTESKNWMYAGFKKYPDVLRYNFKAKQFYDSKY